MKRQGGRARQGATPPTKTAALMAMQRCPAAPNAAPVSAATVASRCASGRTTAWFLAPMLACARAEPGEAAPGRHDYWHGAE
jgi:hypothetical protein